MIIPIFRAFSTAAFLLIAAPAWSAVAEPPPSPNSVTTAMSEARTLVGEGKFNEAMEILRPLLKADVIEANALFLLGLAATGAAQQPDIAEAERNALLDEAIAAFRTMLIDRPDLVRVRLELARAFFLKGQDNLSRDHFERVLAGNPPQEVAANVRRFLSEIRARRRWSMYLGTSVAPDTNIGGASDERIIYIRGLPFRRDAEDLTTSGVGVSVWTGGEYQYPLGDRLRLRAGADASRREYSGSRFDQLVVSGHIGPRWLAGSNTDVSLLANARRRWTGSAPDHDDVGLRAEARHRFTRQVTANARASWHDRRYRTRRFLDGQVLDFSLGGAWVITPILRADATAGYGRERPERERYRHTRRWLRVGVTAALPLGFTVGGSGQLRWTDYEGNWSPFTPGGEPREDRTRSLRASVHNRALTLYGFSPQVSVVNEVRSTNAQLYDYKRTGGELRFVRQF